MTDTTTAPVTTSEQEYVLAGGKDGATDSPNDPVVVPAKKQGHKCCGGCCDMRRATMIVNFVNMGLILLGLWYIVAYISTSSRGGQPYQVDDDEVQEVYAEADTFQGLGFVVAIMVIRFLCNGCGVYGAYIFHQHFVAVSLAGYILEILFALISFNVAGLLVGVFFAYPHVFLIQEIRAGIMTPENYPNEEQSCCCV
ncbi:expressed unknown protein [Seminavis robusta]|uniref:Uncharacterized protein n=1 Tax=Seminavis robusta TaxID=568900 RepID=A0A9N8H2S1_9STRA|nr:expressed unknown protein [Seminavis robusta]|eukprot:Sro23_g016110.1 n/a (197) ;mRNA; f:158013-158785